MSQTWKCPRCQTLLGIFKGTRLEIRYKSAQYVVTQAQRVETICRKCSKRVEAPPAQT